MIVQVKLLNGFHGRDSNNQLEYPPAPGRLYTAVVNGMYKWLRTSQTDNRDLLREAILYMERLPMPDIYYDNIKSRKPTPTSMVPVHFDNLPDWEGETHKRGKHEYRCFPNHPYVYFHWKTEKPNEYWERLKIILRYVSYFGTPKSLAHFSIKEELPPETKDLIHIQPDPTGDIRLSSYYEGKLRELDIHYEDHTKAGHAVETYKQVNKIEQSEETRRLYKKFVIFNIEGEFSPVLRQNTFIAEGLRTTLLDLCANEKATTLLGKNKDIHVAHLPLPMVGSRYSDGRIMGVGVAIPPCDDFDLCEKIVTSLHGKFIRMDDYEWKLDRINDENTSNALKASTWCVPAKRWISVTPVEVHNAERKAKLQREMAKIVENLGPRWTELRDRLLTGESHREDEYIAYILNHCRQLGLPDVENIWVSFHPILKGSSFSKSFISRNMLKNRTAGHFVHCEIVFSQKVGGPMCLGRTRNYGSGLMKPTIF